MGLEKLKNTGSPSSKATRRAKRSGSIINKRLVRNLLRFRNGDPRKQKHAITGDGYRAVSHMGHVLMKNFIGAAKNELSSAPKAVAAPTRSISANHIVHAANFLKICPTITRDAILSATQRTYDPTACKSSNIRRMTQNHQGKTRVRRDSVPVLWCLVSRLIQELIDRSVAVGEDKGKNIRLRPELLYRTIHSDKSGVLSPFKSFVGPGQGLGMNL